MIPTLQDKLVILQLQQQQHKKQQMKRFEGRGLKEDVNDSFSQNCPMKILAYFTKGYERYF